MIVDSGLQLIADHVNSNYDSKPTGFTCTVVRDRIADNVCIKGDNFLIHAFCYGKTEVKDDTYQSYITVNDTEVNLSAVRKWYKDPEKLAKYIVKQLKKIS